MNTRLRRSTAIVWLFATSACLVDTAQSADKELLDILLSNGAISQEQYEHLIEKQQLEKQDVETVVATLDRSGFNVKSADDEFAIKIGTRLHGEMSTHSGDLPDAFEPVNGSELRRARIETKGTIGSIWSWAAEVDFADNGTSVKDFWLGYTTDGGTKLTFGNQKQPYGLNLEMSSNDIPFIERSIDTFMLLPFSDRAVGFRAEKSGRNWFAAGGIFGETVSPSVGNDDEGWGLAGRYVYAPIIEDDRVLHLGVRALTRAPASNNKSFRIRDETTHLSGLRIVDTGAIPQVDRTDIYGVEAAFALGAFSLVGEYSTLTTNRDGLADLDFDGWHAYGTWSLTGESRAAAYRIGSGEFKRLSPAAEFSPRNGTWGAWEVALRYANIDLNDGAFIGGEESVLTSGLNWYPNDNVRLMLEWSRIVDTDASTELREAADGLNIFQFRTQYTF